MVSVFHVSYYQGKLYYLTKFGSHRHCGCGDKMILVGHIISQDLDGPKSIKIGYHLVKLVT